MWLFVVCVRIKPNHLGTAAGNTSTRADCWDRPRQAAVVTPAEVVDKISWWARGVQSHLKLTWRLCFLLTRLITAGRAFLSSYCHANKAYLSLQSGHSDNMRPVCDLYYLSVCQQFFITADCRQLLSLLQMWNPSSIHTSMSTKSAFNCSFNHFKDPKNLKSTQGLNPDL